MQSRTTRGLRRLLVSTGVISLLLSVAAPSALAGKPVETPGKGPVEVPGKGAVETPGNGSVGEPGDGKVGSGNGGATGTDRVLICHNGRVIEVDDDGDLSGHAKHGDPVVESGTVGEECDATVGDGDEGTPSCDEASATTVDEHDAELLHLDEPGAVAADHAEGDPCDDEPVLVCHDGIVADADQLPADIDSDALEAAGPDAELGDRCGASTKRVRICHEGRIIEVDDDGDLEGHAGHGDEVAPDQAAAVGTVCPVVVVSPETESAPPAKETTTPPPPVTPAQPAQPPLPVGTPKPVIVISDDRVAAPAPAVPAAPAPAVPASPAVDRTPAPEVLGSVTTRTPNVAGSTVTRTGVSTLAATGTSTTTVLAVLGAVLLLAGLGLQLVARRQTAGSALGA